MNYDFVESERLIGTHMDTLRIIQFKIENIDSRGFFTKFAALAHSGAGRHSLDDCFHINVVHKNLESPSAIHYLHKINLLLE